MPTDTTMFVEINHGDWHRIDEIVRVVWLPLRRAALVFIRGYTTYDDHLLCESPYSSRLRHALGDRLYDHEANDEGRPGNEKDTP